MPRPGESTTVDLKQNRLEVQQVFDLDLMNIAHQEKAIDILKTLLLDLVEKDNFKIPMMSDVSRELLSVIDDPDTSFDRLASIVKKDQFLGARMLKVANSPLYMTASPVTRIEDAVRRLGFNEVKRILFTLSMSTYLLRKGSYANLFKQFWEHSMAVAFAAKEISTLLKVDASYAYIGALLHDIGRTFVLIGIAEMEKAMDKAGFFGDDIAKRLSFDLHLRIGGIIAKRWNLSDIVTNSILLHHDPVRSQQSSEIALIVYCAEQAAIFFGYGDEDPAQDPARIPAFYLLGLSPVQVENLKMKLPSVFEKMPRGDA